MHNVSTNGFRAGFTMVFKSIKSCSPIFKNLLIINVLTAGIGALGALVTALLIHFETKTVTIYDVLFLHGGLEGFMYVTAIIGAPALLIFTYHFFTKNEKLPLNTVWKETHSRILPLVGTWLLQIFANIIILGIIALPIIPTLLKQEKDLSDIFTMMPLVILAILVAIIVGTIFNLRLGLAFQIALLEKKNPLTSLKESFKRTKGYIWRFTRSAFGFGLGVTILNGILSAGVVVLILIGSGIATSAGIIYETDEEKALFDPTQAIQEWNESQRKIQNSRIFGNAFEGMEITTEQQDLIIDPDFTPPPATNQNQEPAMFLPTEPTNQITEQLPKQCYTNLEKGDVTANSIVWIFASIVFILYGTIFAIPYLAFYLTWYEELSNPKQKEVLEEEAETTDSFPIAQ